MSTDMLARFERDGFVIVEGLLDAAECAELMEQILADTRAGHSSSIRQRECRLHTPLTLKNHVRAGLTSIVDAAEGVLAGYLKRQQYLCELSSITIFPYAQPQGLHVDEPNRERYLVSCFVNLGATSADGGALRVVPGSHLLPLDQVDTAELERQAVAVELDAGGLVIMSSKLWHAGGGNSSTDRVRPVFYASFGDADLQGPVYSIRSEYRQSFEWMDFSSAAIAPETIVAASESVRVWQDVCDPNQLLVVSRHDLGEMVVDESLLPLLRQLMSREPSTVAELALTTGREVGELGEILGELRALGVARCLQADG